MTVTINIPTRAEVGLQAEAQSAGVTVPDYLERLVLERFVVHEDDNSIQALFDRIARPAPEVDLSREGIYADF